MRKSILSHRIIVTTLIAVVFIALFLGIATLQNATAPAVYAANIDSQVYQAIDTSPSGETTFVVTLKAQTDLAPARQIKDWDARGQFVVDRLQGTARVSQADLLDRLERGAIPGKISHYQSFWIANVIFVTGDRVAAEAIARRHDVARIVPEMKIDPPEPPDESIMATSPDLPDYSWGIEKIGADQVWSTGATGQGIVIGVVDTGAQWDHTALKDSYRGWNGSSVNHNYNWYNPSQDCDDSVTGTCDDNGHGTHTTGTSAGGDSGNPFYGDIGVAPGAKWIHALGCCPDNETLMAAMEWMLAPTDLTGQNPDSNLRPQVVNNSWGGPGGSSIFEDVIESWRAAGIVPVFSAGNEGSGCGTMGSPGDNVPSFNVGSTTSSDVISSFSSRGPNPFTGRPGPEVSAPGSDIGSSVPGDSYARYSGTSMAAPHVTGAVAVLLSAEPDLIGQVNQIEEIFRATAVQLTSAQTCGGVPGSEIPNSTFGHGRINLLAAVEMSLNAGTLSGVVTDASSSDPIANALVSATRNGHTLTQRTDASGAYSFIVGSGTYNVKAEAFGYTASAPVDVSVSQDATTDQDFALAALSTGTVSGVVDENSVPNPTIAGATVELVEGYATYSSDTSTTTGDYSLMDVPFGSRTVEVSAPGYASAEATVSVSGPTAQDFSLDPAPDYQVGDGGDSCSVAYDWIDATDGTAHNMDDDANKTVSLPSPFTFYDNSYSSIYISSNGFISFGQGYDRWHGTIPFEGPPNNVIYGLGEDLNPEGGSQGVIYTKDLGDGRFVIEYHQVEHWLSGFPETFEIVLDTTDDSIVLQYHTVSWPDYANVGIENDDGSRGVLYSYANNPPITAGLAVKFTPFSGQPPDCAAAEAPDPLAIERSGSADALLRWQHIDPNTAYEIWRNTAPYFDPDQGEGSKISTEPATAGEMTYPDAGVVGNPAQNHFYVVRGYVSSGASGPSNQVGEFDFELMPGNE